MRKITTLLMIALLAACGGEGWEDVSSVAVGSLTLTAGDAVRLEPTDFHPVEISEVFSKTAFSFEGTLLDDSRDLVLISTISLDRSYGDEGDRVGVSVTLSTPDEPIQWSRSEATRSVEIEYFNMGDINGKGRFYLYLTDPDGNCMSNIISWPVTIS